MDAAKLQRIALPPNTVICTPFGATYVLETPLGAGGFGITYRALFTDSDGRCTEIAIKEHFVSEMCEREGTSQRVTYSTPLSKRVEDSKIDFMAEAKRLQLLGRGHDNIVSVGIIFEANNTAYYTMEYLNGTSLGDLVKQHGRLTPQRTAELMLPIMDAVAYLHRNHVTHLDIKPDNIMLSTRQDGTLRPVLIDFGLSKHYDANDSPTSTIHTQGCSDGYSPIEQYSGITTFMPTADVYALGATLVYCLTGKRPPKASDISRQTLRGITEQLPEPFRSVVAMAMEGSHFDRCDNVDRMIGPIFAAYPPAVPAVPKQSEPEPAEPENDETHILDEETVEGGAAPAPADQEGGRSRPHTPDVPANGEPKEEETPPVPAGDEHATKVVLDLPKPEPKKEKRKKKKKEGGGAPAPPSSSQGDGSSDRTSQASPSGDETKLNTDEEPALSENATRPNLPADENPEVPVAADESSPASSRRKYIIAAAVALLLGVGVGVLVMTKGGSEPAPAPDIVVEDTVGVQPIAEETVTDSVEPPLEVAKEQPIEVAKNEDKGAEKKETKKPKEDVAKTDPVPKPTPEPKPVTPKTNYKAQAQSALSRGDYESAYRLGRLAKQNGEDISDDWIARAKRMADRKIN